MRSFVDKKAPGMAIETIVGLATLLVLLVVSAISVFVYNHKTFAAKEDVQKLETQTVQTFENFNIQQTLDELEKLDAKEKFNEGGLNKYDEVRKKQLERKLETLQKKQSEQTK